MTPEINWIKNDPEKYNWHTDGSEYLIAVLVKNNKTGVTAWEFDCIAVDCDGDHCSFKYKEGDVFDKWDWESIDYFHLLEGFMPTNEEKP